MRFGFPSTILRLTLESFAFARVLVYNGALSDATLALSAILAGGSFATDALYLVLMGPCDKLCRMHPAVSLCLFVDDLKIGVTGSEGEVAEVLPAVLRDCIELFENTLHVIVSRGSRWRID